MSGGERSSTPKDSEETGEESNEEFGSFPSSPSGPEMPNSGTNPEVNIEAMDTGSEQQQSSAFKLQPVDLNQFDQAEMTRMMAQAQVMLQLFRNEFDDRHNRLQTRVTTVETTQQAQDKTLAEHGVQLKAVAEAQDAVDLRAIEIGNKVAVMELKVENSEALVNEVDVEVRRQSTEIDQITAKQTELQQSQTEVKDNLRTVMDKLEEQGKQIAHLQQTQGSQGVVSDQQTHSSSMKKPKAFQEYMNLVKTASGMGVNFTLGEKPPPKPEPLASSQNTNSTGVKKPDSSASSSQNTNNTGDTENEDVELVKEVGETLVEIGDFLDSLDLPAKWEIFPVTQNSRIFRLVPGDGFEDILQDVRTALGSVGWWISRSSPNHFRQMEGRTRKFLAKLKTEKKILASTWFNLQNGFVYHLGTSLFPFFLVPVQEENWPPLFDHIEENLTTFANKSWVEQFQTKANWDGKAFVKKFAELAKLDDLL